LAEAVNELREALFNSYEEKTMPGEVERILQLTTDGAVAPNPSICKTCNTSIGIWRNGNYIIVKCKCATIGIGIDRILKMRDDLT
jgi:hypothetical protein